MPCGSSFSPFSLLWYVGEQLTCHLIQPINVNKLSPFLNLCLIQTWWESAPKHLWAAFSTITNEVSLFLLLFKKYLFILFMWKKINHQASHWAYETEEWTCSCSCHGEDFKSDWLEAWPEAFWRVFAGLWHLEWQDTDQQQAEIHTYTHSIKS